MDQEKQKRVTAALDKISKSFGKGAVVKMSDKPDQSIEVISTGSLGLDVALGVGGLPKGRIVEIYGPESSGKAQPLFSKILTPQGFVYMKDVQIGTVVNTPDGQTSTVIGIYPQGQQDVYKITFDDKSTAKCTKDHLWSVQTRDSELWNVMTVDELLQKGLQSRSRKFKIPHIQPCIFTTDEALNLDPYLLGVLLGDGCLRDSITLSNLDEELLVSVRKILNNYNMELSQVRNQCDYGLRSIKRSKGRNYVAQQIYNLNLLDKKSEGKFIPTSYLQSSVEDRIALFQGLVDTDGHVYNNQHSIQYTTVSKQLAEDFVFLARSLGMRATVSNRINSYTAKTGNKVSGQRAYYINCLHGDFFFQPARLSRKQQRTDKLSTHRDRFIESIQFDGREECQCIMIGHPDSLYITDEFIVTHNTTIATHVMAEAQKKGGTVAMIDVEHAFDSSYAEKLGVDLDALYFSQPDWGEQALEIACNLIESGGFDVVVIDSVAALTPKAELDGEMGDAKMGLQARMMGQAMRKIVASVSKTNTLVIFINQLREKIGVMFGSPETTSGGNALKFYASVRLDVRRSTQIKDGDQVLGNRTKVKVIKNKVAPPFKFAEFDVVFGEGISKVGEVIDLGVQYEIVQKSGSWFSYDTNKLGQGRDAVKQLLIDNPELMEEIEAKIRQHIIDNN